MNGSLASYKERLISLITRKGFPVDLDTPVGEAGYVVLDTELTGLDMKHDSLVSIGAVRMKGGRIDVGDTFYRLSNPSSQMNNDSVVIHGITPSELADQPPIERVLYELIGYCRDDVVVGHFISIDLNFINREMKNSFGTEMKNAFIDTCSIHEWMKEHDGSFRSHYNGFSEETNLFALAKRYDIPVSGAHNAMNDAFITAQLFQRFLSFLPGFGVRTLRDLLRIGKP